LLKIVNIIIFIIILAQNLAAQYYSFGRNKVQYEEFDWKVLKTEHFDIYYYNELREIAETGAFYAEEAYNDLKVKLNHIVTRRIPLIFYNTHTHFQQTNTTSGFIPEGVGGFFEFIKGRVVIPYMGSLDDFRHVIRHELVHVFMTNKVFRVLADHRLPSDVLPPLWFVEGIAEYMSTEVDAQAEMVMRDAVISGYFYNIQNIDAIYGSFLMYKEGQNFLEFVEEKYGVEKVPQILENIWMYSSFIRVIEHTIGKKITEIDEEWEFYLKKKYFPLLEDKAPTGYASKRLTFSGFNFSPAVYKSGDKKYIYFIGNIDGYSSLYRLELKERGEEDEEDMPEPELVLRGEKTEELESFHLMQSSIDISRDGIITFVSKTGGTDAIHFYSIKSSAIEKTFQHNDLISITSPKFSSDGSKIAFHAVDQKGFSDLYIYNIALDSLRRLTNDPYDERDPSFGLTDNTILFTSDRTAGRNEKKYNLFSYELSSGDIKYITSLGCNNYTPVISPGKKYLYFTSDYDKVRNIWKMDISSGFNNKIEQVTNFTTSAFYPSFIDTGKLVFSGFENFSFNLYEKDLNDSVEYRQTVVMSFDSTGPVWVPRYISPPAEKGELKYEKEYTLDYAQSQVTTDPIYGTRGGAVISLSDLFGDDNYYFLLYNTAEVQSDFLKSFNVAIQRINVGGRSNYGYGLFHFSGRRYDIRDSDEYYYERSFGGFFLLHFPISKFQRIETSVTVTNSDKEVISGVIERKALLVNNNISWVIDNSLWGPSGPLDGMRARLLLGYTGDVKYSNVNYFTFMADYRHYFRLGYMSALAFRSALFYNEGKEARRYFMGGSWDLRGWPRWSIRGEKLWLSSLELRFPLIDLLHIRFPFVNLGFTGIRAAIFADAGGAWDTEYRQTLGSVGAGFRFNLFNVLVLRYDIGKKIENDFKNFQPGLFYQFFFGWDF
jgi:hypothetical protein